MFLLLKIHYKIKRSAPSDALLTLSSFFSFDTSKKFVHFKRVFLLANIKAQIMRLHFILAVFVLAMVSSSPPFFHASAEDDQCVGFLENCEKNCGEGKLNENKSRCVRRGKAACTSRACATAPGLISKAAKKWCVLCLVSFCPEFSFAMCPL